MKAHRSRGTPDGTTSCAHMPATCWKAFSMPIFLLLQGTWMATVSFTFFHSSLSFRKVEMNSMGSYSENLQHAGAWSAQGACLCLPSV